MSIQETGANRLRTTSSTLSPSTDCSLINRKSDCSFFLPFPAQVAESEFRTRPVTTAVGATGWCKHHTYLYAQTHNFLVRTSQCTIHAALHFSNVGTPHWLKVKRNLCRAFLCTHISISFAMSSLNVPFVRFPPVLFSPTCSVP